MNVISEIQRINQLELSKGLTHTPASWHSKYSSSAWINIGSLPLNLSEGDIICIFSQYGEIDDVHLVREADTGKSRGFAFLKYEDARSCVLAVDNLGGSCVLGRMLRVDHVERYRLPKHVIEREEKEALEAAEEDDSDEKKIEAAEAGHAYKGQELASEYDIHAGQDLFAAPKKSGRDDDLNQREDASITHDSMDNNAMDSKAERKRRKEERAQKRKEKEEHRRRKEEQKRKKHSSRSSKDKKRRRSRSRS
mmetsp:Transcript_34504/g.70579  ORF Transcript_34504/g.70579 Transcript_34504/m.70579 type:complete len:251 (+) Transcript_34504:95-847(+)